MANEPPQHHMVCYGVAVEACKPSLLLCNPLWGHNHRASFTPCKLKRTGPFTSSWGTALHPWSQASWFAFQGDSTRWWSSPRILEPFLLQTLGYFPPSTRFALQAGAYHPCQEVNCTSEPKLALSTSLHTCRSSPPYLQPRRHLKTSFSSPNPQHFFSPLQHNHTLTQSCPIQWGDVANFALKRMYVHRSSDSNTFIRFSHWLPNTKWWWHQFLLSLSD